MSFILMCLVNVSLCSFNILPNNYVEVRIYENSFNSQVNVFLLKKKEDNDYKLIGKCEIERFNRKTPKVKRRWCLNLLPK